jgi:hypothetical protein
MDLFEAKEIESRVKELSAKYRAEGLSDYEIYLRVRQDIEPLDIGRAVAEIIMYRLGLGKYE